MKEKARQRTRIKFRYFIPFLLYYFQQWYGGVFYFFLFRIIFFSSFLCFPTSVVLFFILFLNFCFLSDSILIGCTAYAAEARKHFIEVRERKIEREEERIEIERIKIVRER